MKSIKAAIIGLGGISPMHINSLKVINIPIVAVCDKDADKAGKIANELGAKAYTNYQEMLADGGFDVLHICLPHFLHAPVAIAAMEHGVHVLTEKPMATTIQDAKEMIAQSKANNVCLGVIFQNRYSPGAQLIKNALVNGALGKVTGGWMRVNWFRSDEYYTSSDWRGKWATEGGGVLINQSIHSFDMLNFFLGTPTSVNASIANRAHPCIEVEDMAEGIIMYDTVPISFFVNTYHPYDMPASVELICENGKASLVGEEAEIVFKDGTKKTAGPDIQAQQLYGEKTYWGVSHIKQIEDFYNALASGVPFAIDGAEALRTQQLISDIYATVKQC